MVTANKYKLMQHVGYHCSIYLNSLHRTFFTLRRQNYSDFIFINNKKIKIKNRLVDKSVFYKKPNVKKTIIWGDVFDY